ELTTRPTPDENDSAAELEARPQWLVEKLGTNVPLHFTAFHPDWKMLDKTRTPAATLTRARTIALRNGLKFVYTGNVHDPTGSSTYCPGCAARVIERDWYEIGDWRLDDRGCCSNCGTQIPGVFSGRHGDWGAKRMGVRIADPLAT